MPLKGPSQEVVRLANNGQKINAIKQYRKDTGAGLAEAKAVVDRLPRGAISIEPAADRAKASRRAGLFLGATVLGFIGLCITGTGVFRALSTSEWFHTEGEILQSQLVQGSVRVGDYVAVKYEYVVSGARHEGDRVNYAGVFGSFYNDMLLARYPAGAAVDVYYDRDTPSRSVLERDIPLLYWIVFGASIFAFLLGVKMWVQAAKREKANGGSIRRAKGGEWTKGDG